MALAELEVQVQRVKDSVARAVAHIRDLVARLAASAGDPAKIEQLTSDLEVAVSELDAAMAE